jgi:two-component system chemotaxis sensor kinase CheA
MHSLKGASGFLGLNKINGLAHKAENILDELRQGSMRVTGGIMDLILSATDALRTMVDNLESSGVEGDVDTAPIIARIESALAGTLEEADVPVPTNGTMEPVVEHVAASDLQPEAVTSEPQPAPEAVNTERVAMTASFHPQPDPDFDDAPYGLSTVGEGHLADFLEEAVEIIENLNRCLLALEGNPDDGDEMINDTFRYFHNLKGNSGIIGFKELNSLTHEAETLLNRVRKGDMECSQGLIDLLLSSVDLIEELVGKVDVETNRVTPIDTSVMAQLLQKVTEEGDVAAVAEALAAAKGEALVPTHSRPEPKTEDAPAAPAGNKPEPDASAATDYDPEDVALFLQTIKQQLESAATALAMLREDAGQADIVDGLFRTFQTIQNSAGYMGLAEIKEYSARTVGLVDQGRKSNIDFSLMLDILDQEFSILKDMLLAAMAGISGESVPDPTVGLSVKGGKSAPAAAAAKPSPRPAPAAPPPPASTPSAPTPPARKAEPEPEIEAESDFEAESGDDYDAAPPAPARPAPARAVSNPASKSARPAAKTSMSNALSKNAAAAAQQQAKPKASSTIRVDHHKLDHLMNVIGELIINRNRYAMLARALEEGHEDVHVVAQQLTETTYAMARISDDLQDTIMKVRMVPVQTVFSRFPRLVRDLSRKSGKQVELIMEGEETEFDKSVVEEIGDPLVHLVRNAVDHGLEDEEERIKAGKKPKGHVWLRAYHKGNSVAIEVEDDGRGIDPDKLKRKPTAWTTARRWTSSLRPGSPRPRRSRTSPAAAWAWTWSRPTSRTSRAASIPSPRWARAPS